MKISNLKIKNIKCFKEADIPFENEKGEIKDWSLIVGNNGVGKTTILRCLAFGLCDRAGADALLAELYGGIVRHGKDKGSVEITLKGREKIYKFVTEIKLQGDSEAASQKVYKLDSSGKETEVEHFRPKGKVKENNQLKTLKISSDELNNKGLAVLPQVKKVLTHN